MVQAVPLMEGAGQTVRDVTGHQIHGAIDVAGLWASPENHLGAHLDLTTDTKHIADFEYTTQSIPMSVALWIRPDASGDAFYTAWGNQASFTNDDLYIGIDASDDHLIYAHDAGSGGTRSSLGAITIGEWIFVGMVLDGTQKRGYLDGDEVVNTSDSTTTDVDNGENFALGQGAGNNDAMKGAVGPFYRWDRGLGPAEFEALYRDPYLPFITKPR